MMEFARETGLSPASSTPRRYLWTDAFAVCNLLGLYQETAHDYLFDLTANTTKAFDGLSLTLLPMCGLLESK